MRLATLAALSLLAFQEAQAQESPAAGRNVVDLIERDQPCLVEREIRHAAEPVLLLAATKLAQTNLRNIVGDLQLDDALTSRDMINAQLRQVLDEATDVWGTRVVRVEIQRIDPPPDITEAMHRQMKAERDRRATVTEAEGEKRAAILRAEGVKEARILEAQGQAQAIREVAEAEKFQLFTVAEGEAQAIERVFGAIHTGDPTPDLIAIRYLDALPKIADGQATKLFLPYEASGILSSLAAIREIWDERQKE